MRISSIWTRPVGLSLGLLLACNSSASKSSPEATDGAADTNSDAGVESSLAPTVGKGQKVGSFELRLIPKTEGSSAGAQAPAYTSLSGKVFDGVVPPNIVWNVANEMAGCQLLVPSVPFCDPPCGSAVCVADGVCADNPKSRNVGTVTLGGLKGKSAGSVMSEPVSNSYSLPAGTTLDFPPFAEGDLVTLDSAGGDYAPFRIVGQGILPLALEDTELALDANAPLKLRWQAPSKQGVSRIFVKLDISHHGGSKGKIECEVDDSGALDIAQPLIEKLINLGVSGFPTVIVTRAAINSVDIEPGRVDLKIYMSHERPVTVSGLVSCTTDEECPNGQTCQSDLSCH